MMSLGRKGYVYSITPVSLMMINNMSTTTIAAAAVRQLHYGAVPVASWILVGNGIILH